MARVIEGKLSASGLRFAIVVSRFNSLITDQLVEGALDAIRRTGGDIDAVDIVRTPGAFEIPAVARAVCATSRYDALVCLGAVIRGSTPHHEYISAEVTKGIAQLQMQTDVPIGYGVITPDTLEQAIERAGTKGGNKGFDAAMAAIELASLLRELSVGASVQV